MERGKWTRVARYNSSGRGTSEQEPGPGRRPALPATRPLLDPIALEGERTFPGPLGGGGGLAGGTHKRDRPCSPENAFPGGAGAQGALGGQRGGGLSFPGGEQRLSVTSSQPGRPAGRVSTEGPPAARGPLGRSAQVSEGRQGCLGARRPAGTAACLAIVPVAAEVHLDGQGAVGAWLVLAAVIWGRDMAGGRGGGLGHHRWPRGKTQQDLPLAHPLGGGPPQQSTCGQAAPTCPFPGPGATGLPPGFGPSSPIPLPPLSCPWPFPGHHPPPPTPTPTQWFDQWTARVRPGPGFAGIVALTPEARKGPLHGTGVKQGWSPAPVPPQSSHRPSSRRRRPTSGPAGHPRLLCARRLSGVPGSG